MPDAKSIAATAWMSGNTSKASHHNLIEPEQRVVPHFLFVQIISVMKQTNIVPRKREKYDEKPYGHIAGVVKTEWGYMFNVKQMPS